MASHTVNSPNILSLGDLLLDVVVRYDPEQGQADVGRDAVQVLQGGSAANFAVHAARLGAQVQFVTRVGADWAGEMLVRSLSDEGVAAHVRTIDDEATGRVLAMVDARGHSRMWSYPGASSTLSAGDLKPEWFRDLDAFHLTGYSLLRDGPREAALRALEMARMEGTAFCTLDPNPAHLIVDFGPDRFRRLVADLAFDALLPNLDEGKLLTGKESPDEIVSSLLEDAPIVVLTMGEEGCIAGQGSKRLHVPAEPAQPVDATGAGDAFAAAFVVEYLGTRDPFAAARAAGRLAARVVSKLGAR
ncbi:MAG TPA: PfkB family carbohydrate kinase [Chloroflexia bacterium]|nr:PfkB family carbohydrate kinase [Chloroflexia bacterium]